MDELSGEQIAFFRDNGYLILRGAIDTTACDAATDLLWSHLPGNSSTTREDPDSWEGPWPEAEISQDGENLRHRFQWRLRQVRDNPQLYEMVYAGTLLAVAEQLLGKGQVHIPEQLDGGHDPVNSHSGIRGIYCTRPYGELPRPGPGFHTDGHPFHLGVVAFLQDVVPDGGGFQVWPGSHRTLYPTFLLQYDQPRIVTYVHLPAVNGSNDILHTAAYTEETGRLQGQRPVDCHGGKGDVVLWHHRLGHAGGHNYSTDMRIAVLADYHRRDLDKLRRDPPQADMWRDWSDAVRDCDAGYSDQFARSQLLDRQ